MRGTLSKEAKRLQDKRVRDQAREGFVTVARFSEMVDRPRGSIHTLIRRGQIKAVRKVSGRLYVAKTERARLAEAES